MSDIERLARAVSVIARRCPSSPVWATHEEIWIYATPGRFDAAEIAELKSLGWTPGKDDGDQIGFSAVFSG